MAQRRDDCCGISIKAWAMASSIANGIYWALMTLLAILAHSQLSNQEEVSTAEGNEASVWQNPLMVSLSLSILFPVLALSSFSLTFLISACTDAKHAKRLKITSYILTAVAVFAMAWSFGGAVMSFGSAAEEIQTACDTIDTECYDKYSMLKWVSIPAEIIGLFLLVWMFVATYHYRKELDPSFTNIPGRPTHSSSKYPKDDPEAAAPLTSYAANPAQDAATSNSLGRHSSRSKRSSRRSKKAFPGPASEYSMSKRSSFRYGRSVAGYLSDSDDGRRSRTRSASRSAARLRQYEREAEAAVERSLSHARHRSGSRGRSVSVSRVGGRGRSGSRSRGRGSFSCSSSSDEEGRRYRSMGKKSSARRLSRSRLRRSESSSDDESSDGGRRGRSKSRSRSRR